MTWFETSRAHRLVEPSERDPRAFIDAVAEVIGDLSDRAAGRDHERCARVA